MTRSITPPVVAPDQQAAIVCAADAVNAASLGKSCIERLGFIFDAIKALSGDEGTIRGLALTGCYLADDLHGLLDCEVDRFQEKLTALKGGQA